MKLFARKVCSLNNQFIFIYATGFSAISADYLNKKLLVLLDELIEANRGYWPELK